ncbi:hypothetical protein OG897_11865 [Streptomyces sp. NBC_00237]|uniref:hypothetical protein n=1 Tax=Streptomyces sp. NBC_00237 TaxID=2975687 RepID=UPI00225B73B8|nr:hypothetical protein [Streptomyces sp. NBC_00237]MCX5202143.1 hypothetical protein [Streptomyces sp. NBC_00237]
MAELSARAREWQPGDDDFDPGATPCVFGPVGSSDSLTVRVGRLGWPLSTAARAGWHRAGGGVLSGWWLHEDDSRYAFPCKVTGSHSAQQEQIPLSVRLNAKNLDGFTPELRNRVAAALARTMATQLHCANRPAAPARLTTPPYNPVRSTPSHSSPNPTNSPRYSTRSTHSPGQAPTPR